MALATSLLATGGLGAALAVADRSAGDGAAGSAAAPGVQAPPAAGGAVRSSPAASAAAPATSSAAAGYRDGIWTGSAEWTRWGYVQVRATVQGGRIVDVTALRMPSDRRSASINGRAQPILERQAIAQQDADLDIVSGATYTSRTYANSLQAALDTAASAAATTSGGRS